MVKLAIAIAEKILHQEVSTRKEIILEVLKGALKNIAETEGMKIRHQSAGFPLYDGSEKRFSAVL